ncbi:MAG: SprT-like domain-containing protein [Nostocoides sp.]
MARRLVREHGLEGWTVRLDRAKTRAGVCRFAEREIGLSKPLTSLHSEDEVRDTVLHEIAHALVGSQHGHDRVWHAKALAIGSSGERCVSAESPRIAGDWLGICPAGHEASRHRRPTRVTSCSRCRSRFSVEHLMSWTYRGHRAPMHPRYLAELEQLQATAAHAKGRSAPSAGAPWRQPTRRPVLVLGDLACITAPGRYHGVQGVVEGLGRTRHQVRVPDGILAVPVELLERVPA